MSSYERRGITEAERELLRKSWPDLAVSTFVGHHFPDADGVWRPFLVFEEGQVLPDNARETVDLFAVKERTRKDGKTGRDITYVASIFLDAIEPVSMSDAEALKDRHAKYRKVLRCQEPECAKEYKKDDFDAGATVYKCTCGNEFLREDTDGFNARCPDCSKYGSKIAVGECPNCGGMVEEVREKVS